jgi:uncharacterized membrane protein HdeD (DUF308 family)
MFADMLSRYWWTTLFRGVLWMLFGIFTILQPGISLVLLTLLFGVLALADGIASIATAIAGRTTNDSWWILLLSGIAALGIGLLTLASPQITASALLIYIAVWAIITGLLEIAASIRLRKEIHGEFWVALAGLVSVAFGVFLLARPGVGALSLLWAIAFYAIVVGMVHVVMAFEARGFAKMLRA